MAINSHAPSSAPALLLIGGFAGSGKTSLGKEIARQGRFAFFDKDTLTAPLVEVLLHALGNSAGIHDRESNVYLNHVRPGEYACFLNAVIECLALGVPTVAVAPFLREMFDLRWRAELEANCHNHAIAARVHYLWVFASDETLHRRLAQRASPRDLPKLQNWDQYVAGMHTAPTPPDCLSLESSDRTSIEAQAATVLNLLSLVS